MSQLGRWSMTLAFGACAACQLLLTDGGNAPAVAGNSDASDPTDAFVDAAATSDGANATVGDGNVLAAGQVGAIELVVNEGRAYWIKSRDLPTETVAWCTLPACAEVKTIDAPRATALTSFQLGVAWATSEGAFYYGRGDAATESLGGGETPGRIAGHGNKLYATSWRAIVECVATVGCQGSLYYFEPGEPLALLSAAGLLAWTLAPTIASGGPTRWIRAARIVNIGQENVVRTIVEEPEGVAAFALDGASVYWATKGESGRLFSASVEPSGPLVRKELVAGERGITSVAAGVAAVFYTNGDTGTVSRVPLGGGPSTVIARREGSLPTFVTVRAPFVYWIDGSDGSIRFARTD